MAKIQELARGLETELEALHSARSELTIVAHSLGGIVARQCVLNAVKAGRRILPTSLLLYAVPNTGASLAAIGHGLSWTHSHLSQLRKDSDILDILNEDWVRNAVEDLLSVRYIVGGADKVVAASSAHPFLAKDNVATIIGSDHSSIIQPINSEDIRYIVLRKFISQQYDTRQNVDAVLSLPDISQRSADPLFDLYQIEDKPFYISRRTDDYILKAMSAGHVWLTGPSGSGKTTALRYCAFSSRWNLRQIMLGGYKGADATGIFRALCYELAELQQSQEQIADNIAVGELIAFARRQLRSFPAGTITSLIIEEIPLSGESLFEFVNLLMQLALAIESDSAIAGRVQLAFSSIADPAAQGHQNVHPKVRETIQFISLERWTEGDISQLVNRLEENFQFGLIAGERQAIVAAANGSPRFVKMLFRRWRNGTSLKLPLDALLASVQAEQV